MQQPSQPSIDNKTSDGVWFERATILAIVMACGVAISPNVVDPDLWGHVQYGRDAMRDGIAATTTYSYTAAGYTWINHENLAELLLAVGADSIGPICMLVVKCLLGVGVIVLMMRHAFRRGVGLATTCSVALLVSVNLAWHWSMRPQLITYSCYALMLAMLSWCFQGWAGARHWPSNGERHEISYSSRRLRFLWFSVPLFFVWANSHGGFVAGFCLFSLYLVCRAIEAWVCRGREAAGLIRRFVLMIVVAGLATLINPYGPRLHLWLLNSLSIPRPEITDWHAPDPLGPLAAPLFLLISVWLAALVMTRRSRDLTHLAVMLVTLWQAVEHQRHIPFFAIAFGFWMPVHIDSFLRRYHSSGRSHSSGQSSSDGRGQPAMRWALMAGIGGAFVFIGGHLYGRLSDLPVKRADYPVSAFQFIADHELTGKLVVTYNWAQYAIYCFGPSSQDDAGLLVGFDGRFRTCYPQEIVDMNFDLMLGNGPGVARHRHPASPAPDERRVLEYGQPDLVLLCRDQPHSEQALKRHSDEWTLLYQDGIAQLWGRSSKYDDPSSVNYIPATSRRVTDAVQTGTVTWPATPVGGEALKVRDECKDEPHRLLTIVPWKALSTRW